MIKLLNASFRSLRFPIESSDDSNSWEQAEHTPLNGRGSYIDNVSLPSDKINLSIPLYSPLESEDGEDFSNLFPARLIELIEAMRNPEVGILVHPLRGGLRAKPISYRYSLSANQRNGTVLELSFAEHVENQDDLLSYASKAVSSNAAVIELAERFTPLEEPDLFDSISDLQGSVGEITGNIRSSVASVGSTIRKATSLANDIASLGTSISSTFGQVALEAEKTRGQIDQLGGKARRFKDSIVASGNAVANASELASLADRLSEGSRNNAPRRNTALIEVQSAIALPLLAASLKNSIASLLELNPGLGKYLIVPKGRSVVYAVV